MPFHLEVCRLKTFPPLVYDENEDWLEGLSALAERTVLITGGASGIGSAIARQLAKRKMRIVVNFRYSAENACSLVSELKKEYGVDAMAVQGDVSIPEDCDRLFAEVRKIAYGVDILIHNAGPYMHERKPMVNYTWKEWDYIVRGNLSGVFYLSKLFLPYMREQHWGRIITFGFDRAETAPGWKHRSAFAAAKSGLVSLTRTISMEEASNGITVNMVCPGDISDEWKERTIKEARKTVDLETPVGRPGSGEDVARVIEFLCDEKSDFLTGSVIHVTGGKDVLGKWLQKNRT